MRLGDLSPFSLRNETHSLDPHIDSALNSLRNDAAGVKRTDFVGNLFNKRLSNTHLRGGALDLLVGIPLSFLMYKMQKEELPNGKVMKNSKLEMLVGIGMDMGINAIGTLIGGPALTAVMAAQIGKAGLDIFRQQRMVARRSFGTPNLSALYGPRVMKSQQENQSRIGDSMSFIGNEARHMAARGV